VSKLCAAYLSKLGILSAAVEQKRRAMHVWTT